MDVLEYLLEKIADQIQANAEHISKGSAQNYADYCGMVGIITGLRQAEVMIKDVQNMIDREDFDDEFSDVAV